MNQAILKEIIDKPGLVETLCELATSMSLALAVLKLQEQEKVIEQLKCKLTDTTYRLDATIERLDKMGSWAKRIENRFTLMETMVSEHMTLVRTLTGDKLTVVDNSQVNKEKVKRWALRLTISVQIAIVILQITITLKIPLTNTSARRHGKKLVTGFFVVAIREPFFLTERVVRVANLRTTNNRVSYGMKLNRVAKPQHQRSVQADGFMIPMEKRLLMFCDHHTGSVATPMSSISFGNRKIRNRRTATMI